MEKNYDVLQFITKDISLDGVAASSRKSNLYKPFGRETTVRGSFRKLLLSMFTRSTMQIAVSLWKYQYIAPG